MSGRAEALKLQNLKQTNISKFLKNEIEMRTQ